MPVANPSFETAGASPGQAASWALASSVASHEIAGFSADSKPYENFETGWGNDNFIFVIDADALIEADFTPQFGTNPESFEEGWSNDGFLFHLASAGAAAFDTAYGTGEAHEDFEVDLPGSGTLSSSGTTVTGAGTSFTTQLAVGGLIIADGQTREVASIASNTSCTTTAGFSPALSADGFVCTNWTAMPPFPSDRAGC